MTRSTPTRTRRLIWCLPALAAGLACVSREPPPQPRPEAAALGRLAIGAELAGQGVSQATDGPWRVRSTRSAPAGRDDGAPEGRARLALREEVEKSAVTGGAFHGPGGEIAPDSREPSDPPTSPGPAAKTDRVVTGAGGAGGEMVIELPRASAAVDAALDDDEAEGDGGEASAMSPASSRAGAPAAQPLRAGATDDNADYAKFLEFLATWVDRKEIQELYQPLDVGDRRFVRVVDADGRPVPGAVVSVVDERADRVLWSGTTYGDGRMPYYPDLGAPPAVGASGPLLVEAYVRDADGTPRGVRAAWDGSGTEVRVALPDPFVLPDPIRLDVCFVIDTTGSMGDEIESIKASLLRVTAQLRGLDREFDLRYSAVLYRDIGDDYVTATHAFTADIEAFDQALRAVTAGGGGDGPESLNQAVAQAVDGVEWREDAAKVAFLIADAPPHMDYAGDVPYGEAARAALARGIRIHSVAASGLDPVGTLVFRQIAQLTRGKFIFIEYGSAAASAESHGVAGAVKSDNLEDILFAQLRDEVATYGR